MNAPGIMLIYGLLPFWGSFRRVQAYRRALPGAIMLRCLHCIWRCSRFANRQPTA